MVSVTKRCAFRFAACTVRAAVLICVVFALPATAKYQIRYKLICGTKFLYLEDVAVYYGMSYTPGLRQVTLTSKYSKLVFTRNRKEAEVNGVKVNLSHPPTIVGKTMMIGTYDFDTLLSPLLRGQDLPRSSIRRIMIDPGHGGKDNGTKGTQYLEKNVTLEVAKRLAVSLRKKGYLVSLTRSNDLHLSLSQRPAIATRWKADLFISIHANYVGTSHVTGIETFLLSPPGTASTYSNKPSARKYPGNRFDSLNARLAYDVHKTMLSQTGARDRGVKHARFLVLKEVPCPAILIETGFMSNRGEERKLGSAAYQEKIAAGIAEGILRFHRAIK